MATFRWGVIGLGLLSLAVTPSFVRAAAPVGAPAPPGPLDAQALAQRIDFLINQQLAEHNTAPAGATEDAEFLRRVYLDIGGRIPPVSEVRAFLNDSSPDKRRRVVERLLESPYYVSNFTSVWREQMVPENNNPQLRFVVNNFEIWLRQQIRDNAPYDALVRELITAPVNLQGGPAGRPVNPAAGAGNPIGYYQVNEFKAENLAASTSRMFLGVKLECAQCHDHPFNSWSRQQFWEYAAFFSGVQPQGPNNFFAAGRENPQSREIKIPGTEKLVQARFLDDTEPAWDNQLGTRAILAAWMTSADNPYFARAAVNRLWAHFFGIGLIEPVDEPGDDNPPSHPELLDELAQQFAYHQFDLKYVIQAIVLSKTYQRVSVSPPSGQDEDPRLFARMAVKGLTAEQLFDSLVQATGYREQPAPNQRIAFGGNTPRAEFLNKFASQDKKTEKQTSILQALSLMNGRFIADATSLERSENLAAIADAPFLDTPGRIETLFLAALSRKPRPDELQRLVSYVERGGAKNDPRSALADVFWVLLNSSEFMLNH
ncbi:MAG: DUF1549 and DUF1553 domain-containing protein [Gemmataceae bacterium]